jgi:dihydroorotate dehydrogenase
MPPPNPFGLVRPLLHRFDPETAHALTIALLECGVVARQPAIADPLLATTLFGRPLPHPIGLAAGFDKNARVFARMYGQGFSYVEVGGVTPRPQLGNARPRVFRLPEERAAINRIGFANEGMERIARRLERKRALPGPIGVNLAANLDSADPAEDFVTLARRFAPLADFLTLDISCPNTANGTLFLQPGPLADLLRRIGALFAEPGRRRPPLVAKLSPDLDDKTLEEVLASLTRFGIDGLIVSNTSAQRPPGLRGRSARERGGLSGPPLFERSTQMLAKTYAQTRGQIALIGVGGITTGADAYAKIRAGASAVALYTAMIYRGPAVTGEIARDLAALLRRDGFGSLREAVGADHAVLGSRAAVSKPRL